MPVAKLLVVHGRVQGVGYRDAAVQAAFTLGVTGWVRNRSDGTVAPVGFCGQERLGPCRVFERHPDTGVDRAFLIEGKQLTQQG